MSIEEDSPFLLMVQNPDLFERYILALISRNKEFFLQAKGILCIGAQGRFTNNFEDRTHYALYRAIFNWNTIRITSGKSDIIPIFPNMLTAQLNVLAATDFKTCNREEIPRIVEYYQEMISSIPSEEYADIVVPVFPQWLARRKSQLLIRQFDANEYATADDLVKGLHTAAAEITGGFQPTRRSFGQGIDQEEQFIERIPVSSVPGFNTALGGGFGKKEHTLIIAPSGAGKTVLACQIAACMALCHKKVMLITTEQAPIELEPRIISAQCSIPFDLIKDGGNYRNILSADQYDSYKFVRNELEPWLVFQDWSERTDMSIEGDLDEIIREEKARPGGLDCVILDWIGGALGTSKTTKKEELRLIYQSAANAMALMCKRHDIAAISFAQATAASINKAKIGFTEAAECKTMHTAATVCAGVSALLNQGDEMDDTYSLRQTLYISKARKNKGRMLEIKRDFGHQRFIQFDRKQENNPQNYIENAGQPA